MCHMAHIPTSCLFLVVEGVLEGDELALRASSISKFSCSSFFIRHDIESDHSDLLSDWV